MKKRKQNLPRPAVHRMELWWAALPTVPGHVQRGTRPVVIVSNDLGNASSPVVSVVPCTTQRHKPALPTHQFLSSNDPPICLPLFAANSRFLL